VPWRRIRKWWHSSTLLYLGSRRGEQWALHSASCTTGEQPLVSIVYEDGWTPGPVYTLWSREKSIARARNRTRFLGCPNHGLVTILGYPGFSLLALYVLGKEICKRCHSHSHHTVHNFPCLLHSEGYSNTLNCLPIKMHCVWWSPPTAKCPKPCQ
jgi:hypothetical protein